MDKADKTQYGSFVSPVPRAQGMKAQTTLGLAELPAGPIHAARWIGPLLALGARAWRSLAQMSGKQLVITVTVPRRDFAAVLIGCGWLMAHPTPKLRPPIEALRELAPGTPVRIVTDGVIGTSRFRSLDEGHGPARAMMEGGVGWLVDKINAISGLLELTGQNARSAHRLGSRNSSLASTKTGTLDWPARLRI